MSIIPSVFPTSRAAVQLRPTAVPCRRGLLHNVGARHAAAGSESPTERLGRGAVSCSHSWEIRTGAGLFQGGMSA